MHSALAKCRLATVFCCQFRAEPARLQLSFYCQLRAGPANLQLSFNVAVSARFAFAAATLPLQLPALFALLLSRQSAAARAAPLFNNNQKKRHHFQNKNKTGKASIITKK
ncbi:hypothetical protein [Methanimicrococcus hongohii]|uniref:hypothetical protein n=1 Tax=Methanimicrococcus hongohii TaxID=3028295 RepID=UPI00292CE0BE|nr:hypothetical protein [Methanimicrococcus sp. Hf6]